MDGYPRSNIRRRKRGREGDERSREIKRKTRNLSGVSKIVSRSRNVVAFQPSLFRISRRCSPESCEFLSTCQVFRVSELRGRSTVWGGFKYVRNFPCSLPSHDSPPPSRSKFYFQTFFRFHAGELSASCKEEPNNLRGIRTVLLLKPLATLGEESLFSLFSLPNLLR